MKKNQTALIESTDMKNPTSLTLNIENDPLRDRRRYAVRGDAQVSTDVKSRDAHQTEHFAIESVG